MNTNFLNIIFTISILSCSVASMYPYNQIFAQLPPPMGKNEIGLGLMDAIENKTNQPINNSMSLIDQANNALKNSPLNIIDQANNALEDKTSQPGNNTMVLSDPDAVEKLESIYSLTNTVGMSMVNGVKVNDISIGENNVTATLNYQPTQNNNSENSIPVSVIVTKLPVENLTKFVIFAAESSKIASTLSNGSGSIDSLISNTKLTPDTLNIALNSLDLIRNLQTGVATVTLSSLDNSQRISVQTPGGLISSLSSAPNEFVTVMVVPSLGVGPFTSNFPSIFSN